MKTKAKKGGFTTELSFAAAGGRRPNLLCKLC